MRGRIARMLMACVMAWAVAPVAAQPGPAPAGQPAASASGEAVPTDPLGRSTPRGTVTRFLSAARDGEYTLAREYLELPRGAGAESVARRLFVVLDVRLTTRLAQISDAAEGSRANPLEPDREVVGTVAGAGGSVEVVVVRRTPKGGAPVWLFSRATLDAVPGLYHEVTRAQASTRLPPLLTQKRLGGLRLLDWLVVLTGVPLFLLATAMLNRLLVPLVRPLWRRLGGDDSRVHNVLPVPVRLLLLTLAGRWALSGLPVSLVVRQFWFNVAGLTAVVAIVWLLILLSAEIEDAIRRHVASARLPAGAALLRVLRRVSELVFVLIGFVVVLRRFGIDSTPALAGLGVGGLAVALAAQRTLENVIAGASLVFDQAVRVGDFLKMGTTEGTVDHIGLRSTRIRTLDRTVVSVPNGQIANASLETLSARDKYWFHPDVRLRYDTTSRQLHAVLDGIRLLLLEHPALDGESVRVRFVRLGQSSFDIEVFAYVVARDWSHFLQIQEELLFGITESVERAGTRLAVPAQTLDVARGEAHAAMLPQSEAAG